MTARRRPKRVAREALAGVRLAFAGLATWVRSPRLMLLGAVPAVVAAVLMAAALIALVASLPRIGGAVADLVVGGEGVVGTLVSVTAALAVLAAAGLIAVAGFATLALLIGQPFFEAISRQVDAREGTPGPAPVDEPWHRALRRGVIEGLMTFALSIALALGVLLVGLAPVIGAGAAFALGAVAGGWLLVVELTAAPMASRGIVSRAGRVAILKSAPVRSVAFGMVVFVAFLLPLGAVIAMPAAVAGATLLTRSLASAGTATTP